MPRLLSGIQPTGHLHLGNYLGAIKNWVALQHHYQAFFSIADLHAITIAQDPEALHQATLKTVATYLACGIAPNKCVIFHQSMVPSHCELAWLLGSLTPLGWLNRMTQFKEKAGKHKEKSCLGLYSYPVLMAADILLYQADFVPVGEDQKQHLELSRDIAQAFNQRYKEEFFTIPEPLIVGDNTRVMSLRDGRKKMSKSDVSDYARINLTDDADTIAQKIKKCKSDALPGITYDREQRPEASNLLDIYIGLTDQPRSEVLAKYSDSGFALFKEDLTAIVIETIQPIAKRIKTLENDRTYLENILTQGAQKAMEIAADTIQPVKKIMGFVTP